MEAAVDLFSTQGFHATPTQQISDRAGVSAGTLFRYFRTKEELIDSLYSSIHRALADAVDEAIRPETPIEDQIKNVKRQVLHWMFENRKRPSSLNSSPPPRISRKRQKKRESSVFLPLTSCTKKQFPAEY